MNKVILKNLAVLSLILGLILGSVAPIPYVGGIALTAMLILAAPIVILLLIMAGKADLTSIKDSIIMGSSIGFFTNVTFSLGYCIVTALLFVIFKFTTNYVLSSMIVNSPVWLLIIVILFVSVLGAVTNAFSGLLTYYGLNFVRDMYERKHAKDINGEEKWQNLNQK
ncbi:MAG TPA: hypothetical protein DEO94_01055 [Cyanobacteria bacterium UBA11991]|nr:hypothetical protein [Cyanobacteriota bacterium]MDY6358270.1 hypothetical protein [Cyanobacteriota bacterium]MDY6363797.1 hypothetical protein [Cyanobacteriota bacterium]MDY6382371.1 hypothetical protein [Cyanobacteriota bacterium]HCB10752.1 hypothetical protein [Cyanobacteria bacterium UBA11991]